MEFCDSTDRRLTDIADRISRAVSLARVRVEMHREASNQELFRLIQGMMEYDELFVKWRYTHLRLVARVIGMRVKSLKGVPATALVHGTQEHLFPELWENIPRLTDEYRPTY